MTITFKPNSIIVIGSTLSNIIYECIIKHYHKNIIINSTIFITFNIYEVFFFCCQKFFSYPQYPCHPTLLFIIFIYALLKRTLILCLRPLSYHIIIYTRNDKFQFCHHRKYIVGKNFACTLKHYTGLFSSSHHI